MNESDTSFSSNLSSNTCLVGHIPVRNLWLLMFYASNLFRQIEEKQRCALEENPDELANLIAEMLIEKLQKRIQRNLTVGYQHHEDSLSRVRGKIDFIKTESNSLLHKGKIYCHFDKLTSNTPRNCFMRSALEKLTTLLDDSILIKKCRFLINSFYQLGIIGKRPAEFELSKEKFGRNDADDLFIIELCHLVFQLALPTETEGTKHIHAPGKDIHWVRKLYEKAIAGFYAVTSGEHWIVEGGKIFHWQFEKQTTLIDRLFPSMRTDITLKHKLSQHQIIIDTKFNSLLTKGWHREESFRSSYIYQIYTYLRTQENQEDLFSYTSTGILMHPSVGTHYDESVVIQGHEIRFVTIDLSAESKEIRRQLLAVLNQYEK